MSDALLVAFECRLPDKDYKLSKRDSVEVFLDPANRGETYFQIYIPAKGELQDSRRKGSATLRSDQEWRSHARVASRREGDTWTVEVLIPFRALGAKPKAGDRWGVNFCRTLAKPGKPMARFLTWSPAVQGSSIDLAASDGCSS